MKLYLIKILILLVFFKIDAQQVNNSEASTINNTYLVTEIGSSEIDGSSYLWDDWESGIVLVNNAGGSQYFLKYNVLKDRMEFKEHLSTETIKALPNDPSLIVQIKGRSFQFIDFSDQNKTLIGYFEIIKGFDSKNLLLQKFFKRIEQPGELQKTGYASAQSRKPSIKSSSEFFYVEDGKITEIQNHKRRSLKVLDESKEGLLKSFINENDIDFEEDGKGLLELIAYYRTLK